MASPIAIKRKVFDLLQAGLTDFGCTWGFTEKSPPKKWCYLGDTSWPRSEWKTNRSREHDMSIPIVLNAILSRTSPEEAEDFIMSQLATMEAAFNADSELRSLGIITWGIEPRAVGTQPHADGGVEAQGVFELQVTYRP